MKVEIGLGSHAGEKTCIATTLEDGCCKWLQTEKYGQRWWCSLFNAHLVDGIESRLRRLPTCVKSTVKETECLI